MNNQNEQPALFVDPKLALEVARQLKAACPDQFKDELQDVYGVITERDLVFYSLGHLAGWRSAETSFRSIRSLFASRASNTQKGEQ